MPGWLVFTEAERSFTIAGNAGAVVGVYQISVAVEDSGEPVLGSAPGVCADGCGWRPDRGGFPAGSFSREASASTI